jgi:DNA-binding transcriptional LysR family regulator
LFNGLSRLRLERVFTGELAFAVPPHHALAERERVELAAYGFGVAVASESYLFHNTHGRVGILKPRSHEPLRYSWVLASATRGVGTKASAAFLQFTNAQLRA